MQTGSRVDTVGGRRGRGGDTKTKQQVFQNGNNLQMQQLKSSTQAIYWVVCIGLLATTNPQFVQTTLPALEPPRVWMIDTFTFNTINGQELQRTNN